MAQMTLEEKQAAMAKARGVMLANRDARKTEKERENERKAEMPDEPLEDPVHALQMSDHHWLGEPRKSLYIPSWYRPHRANVTVTQNGKPLGFRVGDVLPHRRWAVGMTGELMKQQDFEPRWIQYLSEISPQGVDPALQHIPRVERFVNAMPDPRGGPGYVEIGFDPHKPAPAEDNGMRYDPDKDVIWSLKEQMERNALLEQREMLTQMFLAKQIDAATFEARMRAIVPTVESKTPEVAAPVA